MTATRLGRARTWLARMGTLIGIVLLSVASTLAAQRLLVPTAARAQSGDASEIRASAFVLVGADGTEIARLGPGSQGAGNLKLFDQTGQLRIAVSGAGDLLAYGNGGTALAQLYAKPDDNSSGLILRDPDGNVRVDAGQSPDNAAAAVRVHDGSGQLRVGIGTLASETGGSTADFGLRVRDSSGAILTTLP
jgi:hypothetical protein